MDETDRLGGAFLADGGVRILIALVGNVIDIGNIGPNDLPIEPGIFQLDLAVGGTRQHLTNARRSGELSQSHWRVHDHLLRHWSTAVEQIHIRRFHSAIDEKTNELLHNHGHLFGWLQHGLVPHVQGAHQLEHGDFQGKVERSHQCDWSVRPTMPNRHLPVMITGHTERFGQTTHIVPAKVVEERGSHLDFTQGLRVRFWHTLHDGSCKEFCSVRLRKCMPSQPTNLAILHVSIRILQRIVESRLRNFAKTIVEGPKLIDLRIRRRKDGWRILVGGIRNGDG
mmetsp:Transcript_19716/g.55693  ORF Transcript_19716/g.55693 Transcript_19716/m.55693 type:complete len:282 (+) Transcript_19716:979-1824(+)